jgi:hypothetical protein
LSDPCSGQLSSVQKRLAEKAAKQAAKANAGGSVGGSETPNATGSGSTHGDSTSATPMTNRSAAGSQEDLMSMEKLRLATDRYVPHQLFNSIERTEWPIAELYGVLLADVISRTSAVKSDRRFLTNRAHLLEAVVPGMVFSTAIRWGLPLGQPICP